MPLYTFGHGTLSSEAFVALLNDAHVTTIVDVRTVPKSRHNPQFTDTAMQTWLPQAGIAYAGEPRLGGFRRARADSPNIALRHPSFRGYADYMLTPSFSEARDAVLARAQTGTLAIMCSESVWWRCHRRLIADSAMLVAGTAVLHLMHDGRVQPHRPTDGVRRSGDELIYDGGQGSLFAPTGDAGTVPS